MVSKEAKQAYAWPATSPKGIKMKSKLWFRIVSFGNTMRVFVLAVLLAFGATTLTTSNTSQAAAWEVYYNYLYGFLVYHPAEFSEVLTSGSFIDNPGITLQNPDDGAVLAMFGTVHTNVLGATFFDKYVLQEKGYLTDGLAGLHAHLENPQKPYATVDTKEVVDGRIAMTGTRSDGKRFIEVYLFTCKRKQVTAITLDFAAKDQAKYEKLWTKMMRRKQLGTGSATPSCAF